LKGCSRTIWGDKPWYGWMSIMNIAYELADGCTSIVAQTRDGQIIHGRNMDFGAGGMVLTDMFRSVLFSLTVTQNNGTMFYSTSFGGYVGVVSGQKPLSYSLTINTRFNQNGILYLLSEVLSSLREPQYSLVSFLTRDTLTHISNFTDAGDKLSENPLIADVYYIVAGVKPGEGVVISRNQTSALDKLYLNPNRWYVLETNYDNWKSVPWIDDRRYAANTAMKNIGSSKIDLGNILHLVLSKKPVLNIQTIYTILSIPSKGYYNSIKRYCQYPCVE